MKIFLTILLFICGTAKATVPITSIYNAKETSIYNWSLKIFAPAIANHYVDPAATGSNNGSSPTNAWESIADISFGSISAGDSVLFKAGATFVSTQWNVNKSGTAGSPVVFSRYGTGANPLFTGNGSSSITALFYINNRSYLTFDRLTITDPTICDTCRSIQSHIERTFYLDGTTNNVIVQNCSISKTGLGVFIVGSNNTVDHTDIFNTRMIVNTHGGNDDYGANGVIISGASNTVSYCNILECWAISYDFGFDGGNIELFGDGTNSNLITHCRLEGSNGNLEVGSGSGGSSNDNIFSYNIIKNNESICYLQNSGTFVIDVNNLQFINNTIIEDTVGRLHDNPMIGSQSSMASGTLVLTNNIFQIANGEDIANNGNGKVHTYNAYKLTGGSVNYTLSTGEFTTSATLFANNTTYTLIAGSPAIGAGLAGVDMGAVPYIAPSTDHSFLKAGKKYVH